MASSAVDIGSGATIAFGTSSWSAQITGMTWSNITRATVDTSHLGLTASGADKFGEMTFTPGDLTDPGSITIEGHFNPDTNPPIDSDTEEITITFDEGATWVADGFMTEFSLDVPFEDKMTFTATVKFTGGVNITAAA